MGDCRDREEKGREEGEVGEVKVSSDGEEGLGRCGPDSSGGEAGVVGLDPPECR